MNPSLISLYSMPSLIIVTNISANRTKASLLRYFTLTLSRSAVFIRDPDQASFKIVSKRKEELSVHRRDNFNLKGTLEESHQSEVPFEKAF